MAAEYLRQLGDIRRYPSRLKQLRRLGPKLRCWLHRQRLSVLELLGTATSARALLCNNADERPTIKHVLASLVRVASGFHHRPSRTSATSLAARRRTEMDQRHHHRFGATMGLSEDKSPRRGGLNLIFNKR